MGIEPTYGAWEASLNNEFTFCLLMLLGFFDILGVVLGVIGLFRPLNVFVGFQIFSRSVPWGCC